MVPGGGKYPTTPPWKLGPKPQNHPFRQIFYLSIIAGLEPKLFILKSSTQQQSYRAHTIGQFCHQDWPSICLCSKVRDRVIWAFQLTPKWSKVAVGGFCKFGSLPNPQTNGLEYYDVHWKSFYLIPHLPNFCSCGLVADDTVHGKDNFEEKTREDADIRIYHISWRFFYRMW